MGFDSEGEGIEIGEGAEGLAGVDFEPDGEGRVGSDVEFVVDGSDGEAVKEEGEGQRANERDEKRRDSPSLGPSMKAVSVR